MAVRPIPEGYHTATPYLIFRDCAKAIDFYKQAFGATELFRMPTPEGRIGHAEIRIGDSPIMMADEYPDMGYRSPEGYGGSPVSIMLYLEDSDASFGQAIAAGAEEVKPVQDQFYGDRSGTVKDPFGYTWTVATHVEDVPPEEIDRRFKASMEGAGTV